MTVAAHVVHGYGRGERRNSHSEMLNPRMLNPRAVTSMIYARGTLTARWGLDATLHQAADTHAVRAAEVVAPL